MRFFRLSLFPAFCVLLFFAPDVCADSGMRATALAGIESILNENYGLAQARFDSVVAAEPKRPEGYLGRALAAWQESLLLEDGARFKPEIDRQLHEAIHTAKAQMKAHGETARMLFWLGSAYGLRASTAVLYGHLVNGVFDGLTAIDYFKAAVARDSTLVDADFGLGLTEYVIARRPMLLRVASRLFSLPPGNRKGGLALLDRVAREGTYCRQYAISSRAYLELYYEKNPYEARRRFSALLARYPHSLDYRIRYLDAIFALTLDGRIGYRKALLDSVASIRQIAQQRGWKLERWTRTKLIFIEGYADYLGGDGGKARERLETYVREADSKSWLLGPTELFLGKMADMRGDRKAALDHYRRVRKYENVWGVYAEAARYQAHPFTGGPPSLRSSDPIGRFPAK